MRRLLRLLLLLGVPIAAMGQGGTPPGAYGSGSGASAAIGTVGPFFNVQNATFNPSGTVGKGGCATDISTNATSTVTSAAQLAAGTYNGYTPPAVGDIAWVFNTNGNLGPCFTSNANLGITSTLRIPATASTVTTITGVNLSAGTVTLSGSTATTGSGDVLIWAAGGDPGDYTAVSTACNAIGANGGTVYLPRGLYVFGTNASNNPTCNIPGTVKGSFSLIGDGIDQTLMFTAPWYNDSFNFGSVFALTNGGLGYESGWALDGGGFARAFGPDTPNDVSSPMVDAIAIRNYNLTSGSTEVMYITGGGGIGYPLHINNSLFTASGTNQFACAVSGPYIITYKNTTCISAKGPFEGTSNSGNMLVNIDGGFYTMGGAATSGGAALLLPSGGTPAASIINVFGGAAICSGFGTSVGVQMLRTGWTLNIDSAYVNQGATGLGCGVPSGNIGGITNISGTVVNVSKSQIGAAGSGNVVNNPSGATFVDAGANTFTLGAGVTGTGSFLLSTTSTGLQPTITGTGACASPVATGTVALAGSNTCPGTSGAATLTLTWAPNAPHGFICPLPRDVTTGADVFTFTSSSATTCVYGAAAIVQNDVITWGVVGQY